MKDKDRDERIKFNKAISSEGDEGKEMAEGKGDVRELPNKVEEVSKEIDELKKSLDVKTKEAKENYEKFLRCCADLENFRKRTQKEKEEIREFANDGLIKDLLVVIDNMERALSHINDEVDLDSIRKGIRLTGEQFFKVLKKFGLNEISALGHRFDPSIHEAVSHEEDMEHEPETVIKVFQKGYLLKGRLLRPAIVAVSKAPEAQEEMERAAAEGLKSDEVL